MTLHPDLHEYVEQLMAKLAAITPERRAVLDELARFVTERRRIGEPARLMFICTHNSRRSQMSQLWAAAAAAWYGVDGVETYSGGTEVTAFNPRAVAAMTRAGFVIDAGGPEDNPRYEVSLGPAGPTMLALSKTWRDETNPSEGFAAVMTCSEADAACPHVRGAASRVALPYDDPKAADGTLLEAETYDARGRQIAIEMFYLLSVVAATMGA